MFIGKLIKTDEFATEKHVPAIEVLKKDNNTYTVEVTVGKEIAHPNTTAHFINYVTLFFKSDDATAITCLGKAEFLAHGESVEGADKGSAHTESSAIFKVTLTKPGKLIAVSYCNIHGLWESELAI